MKRLSPCNVCTACMKGYSPAVSSVSRQDLHVLRFFCVPFGGASVRHGPTPARAMTAERGRQLSHQPGKTFCPSKCGRSCSLLRSRYGLSHQRCDTSNSEIAQKQRRPSCQDRFRHFAAAHTLRQLLTSCISHAAASALAGSGAG